MLYPRQEVFVTSCNDCDTLYLDTLFKMGRNRGLDNTICLGFMRNKKLTR